MSPVGWRRGRPSCPNGPATGSCRRSGRRWRPRCGGAISRATRRGRRAATVSPRPGPSGTYSRAELDALGLEMPPAYAALPAFAAATGLRPEELFALGRRDVDRRARVLTVARTISDGAVVELGKTDGSRRQVPLSRRALGALDAIPPRLDSPLLFPAPMGGLVNLDNWRRRVWAPAVEAAGVARPARPYDMRATSSATRCMPASRCSRSRRSPARASG